MAEIATTSVRRENHLLCFNTYICAACLNSTAGQHREVRLGNLRSLVSSVIMILARLGSAVTRSSVLARLPKKNSDPSTMVSLSSGTRASVWLTEEVKVKSTVVPR